MRSHRGMLPLARIQPIVCGAFAVRADAQERAEGGERVEAPVKAEGELIEVGLQMLRLDAPMMRAAKPCLQVRKDQVHDRQELFGNLRPAGLDNRQVLIAARGKRGIARRAVRDNHCARLNRLFHKAGHRARAAIWDDFQPQPAGIAPAAPHGLVAFLGRARADLDGGHDKHLILRASSLAAHRAADVGFVNLDMIAAREVAADPVAPLPDHPGAQLVQDIEGGFVPAKAKLPLELHRRHAGRHARHKVGTPKPDRKRGFRVLHHGSAHQTRVPLALAAAKHARPAGEAVGLALFGAMLALESSVPADALQIGRARRVIGEKLLKSPQRGREREVVALVNVVNLGGAVHAENTSPSRLGSQPDKHAKLYWPRNTAKHIARITGASVRTAYRWLANKVQPPGGAVVAIVLALKAEYVARGRIFEQLDLDFG